MALDKAFSTMCEPKKIVKYGNIGEYENGLNCLTATPNAVVTCEIKFFQNYFRGLLQLMNIFQHVQCH